MTTPVSHRQSLPLEPFDILRRASAMGRALVGVRVGGALLERIGLFDGVSLHNGSIVAETATGRTVIDPSAIAAIVADISDTPHDTVLAYVDFLDSEGTSVIKVTGLDGPETFEAALSGLRRAALPYVPPLERSTIPVDPNDEGGAPLLIAAASGEAVTLAVSRPGCTQSWTGIVQNVRFGHSYVNVIQADVHLHLKAGAVAGWSRAPSHDGVMLTAHDADGEPLGLSVSGPEAALVALAATA